MPLALGLMYYGFQSVPDGLRSVEELRTLYSSRADAGAFAGGAAGIDGLYALGEMALVRWGELGVWSVSQSIQLFSLARYARHSPIGVAYGQKKQNIQSVETDVCVDSGVLLSRFDDGRLCGYGPP